MAAFGIDYSTKPSVTVIAKIVIANGQRVRMTLLNTTQSQARYHADEVFPGNRSVQIHVIAEQELRKWGYA